MSFSSLFFPTRTALERQIRFQEELIKLLRGDIKELQQALVEKKVETQTINVPRIKVEDTSGNVVKSWTPPRQRVRDFINNSSPIAQVPSLTENDMKFLEQSAQ